MSERLLYEEQKWLASIAEGSESAFRLLFDTYKELLFTFAEGMLKSSADAEEMVQECFTKIWINRASLATIENPGHYLYTMVRNRALDHIRKVAREKRLIHQVWVQISSVDQSLEEAQRHRDYQELIDQALSELPEQKQSVFRLSREQGYSHEEIATMLRLSKSRVNNILVETLRHLKQHLDQHKGEAGLIVWLLVWDQLF